MYDTEEVENDTEPKHLVYTAKEFGNDSWCQHIYVRVSPYQVQCKKCKSGLYDAPDSPIPIEELNAFYREPKTKEYNKWL